MTLTEPLRFAPIYVEKVWGGRALESFLGFELHADGPVGEVWELADRDGCSSVVTGGPLDGRTLRGLMLSERDDLMGETRPAGGDYFPILVKLLDAENQLSVQVHPDEKAAERLGAGAAGKTEAWYILSALPGSALHLGFKPDVDATTFAKRADRHDVVDLLQSYEVKPGEFVFVPPGTVHSIGGGITLIEVQENSDTTFRLFDWDRVGLDGLPRETHTDEALHSIDYEQVLEGPVTPTLEDSGSVNRRARLIDCDAFAIDLMQIDEPATEDTGGRAVVYVVIDGGGLLTVPGADHERRIARGETWLLPAAAREHRFENVDGELRVLRVETKP